jgi:hypothetical protein
LAKNNKMKISGKVTDQQTGEPMPFANVYFSNRAGKISNNTGTTANEFGRYKFDWPGDLWITASFVGYKPQTKPLPSEYSDDEVVNFELESTATNLSGVEIIAKPIKKKPVLLMAGITVAVIAAIFYFVRS